MDRIINFYSNLQKCSNLKVPEQLEYFSKLEWLETKYHVDIDPVFHDVQTYHRDLQFCNEFGYTKKMVSLLILTACVAMPILNYAWKRCVRPYIQNSSTRMRR